jgi:hypothetical protein
LGSEEQDHEEQIEMRVAVEAKEASSSVQVWSNADRLVLVVVLVLIFLAAARTPVDTDMWWHLRSGETTWTEGSPLLRDTYSFTRLGQPWVNHSWMAQIVLYLLFEWGGYLALGAGVALLATGLMVLVFLQQDGPALLRAFLLVLAMTVTSTVLSPRPQVFSLLLFALTGYLLYMYKWRRRDTVWVLVPLFVLWSNLHGGYPLGLLLIGVTVSGEVLNQAFRYSGPEIMSWRQIRKLIIIGVLSALVVVINPNGIYTWLIPFQTVGMNVIQKFVSEWAAPDFQSPAQLSLLVLTLALAGAMGFSRRRIDGSDLVTIIVFGMMAYLARRNFGPFALAATPVLSRHLWRVIQRFQGHIRGRRERPMQAPAEVPQLMIPAWKKGINFSLAAFLILAAFGKLYFVTHPAFVDAHIQSIYPVGAVQWMQEQNIQGKVFNEYAWGGYLVWTLRENPVFVDGRTDLFGDAVVMEWMDVVQAEARWSEVLEHWQVDLILLEPERPVVSLLQGNGWQELYRDEYSVLFGRN